MPLVDDLRRIAAASGGVLERLSGGRDRFGPVAALQFAHGHLSVRDGCGGGYEVTVWEDEGIVAAGRTADPTELTGTLLDRQEGLPVADLCRRHPFLRVLDFDDGNDVLWHVLIEHGDDYLRLRAAIIAGDPTLRGLRPWVGHGTLHLLHRRDRVGSDRYGVAFYDAGADLVRLDVYGDGLGPAETLSTAIARAATAAASW